MKKHIYSLWFQIVLVFFWIMIFTCMLMSVSFYLIFCFYPGNRIPPIPPITIGFLLLLALCSVISGSIISIFAIHRALNPIHELSTAMQKVARGDYSISLNAQKHKGEILYLYESFNQMVRELNSTETLHSDFISNVSHEFKTPLTAISGYATLLQDDSLTPEERDEYIDIIIQSTKGLSRMTGNILQLSHLENQTIICEKELFRIDEQIRQSILRMEPVWSAKNLLISPDLDRITWYGNQELTAHIWNNLLDNAIKFTPSGGDIFITAHISGEWLSVTFQDSGVGMTPEIQAHIFDKFYQGDTSHKKKGNGLGLALVRKIVTLHGGSIHVESCPNVGSSFKLLLPLEPSP